MLFKHVSEPQKTVLSASRLTPCENAITGKNIRSPARPRNTLIPQTTSGSALCEDQDGAKSADNGQRANSVVEKPFPPILVGSHDPQYQYSNGNFPRADSHDAKYLRDPDQLDDVRDRPRTSLCQVVEVGFSAVGSKDSSYYGPA